LGIGPHLLEPYGESVLKVKLAAIDEPAGFGDQPVGVARIHPSITSDPSLKGFPTGWTLPVRKVCASAGAGSAYLICGGMRTMPGLSANPAAARIYLDDHGEIVGLS
jgi:formate--tetrahydrofolate ligase